MKQSKFGSNVSRIERRRNWRDRRLGAERRGSERLRKMEYDCRSYIPRRESDISGSAIEGEIWWGGDRRFV